MKARKAQALGDGLGVLVATGAMLAAATAAAVLGGLGAAEAVALGVAALAWIGGAILWIACAVLAIRETIGGRS